MYAALWRILPGPVWVRILLLVLLIAALLFTLVTWVFPWVQDLIDTPEVTIEA
ncbi:MAG TPA: hypothetical protein PK781_09165 [Terrimesophilobacter sp.]|nr:hypothetical protein [Terrimesophilobacter sp.]HRQ00616.1 hypothetical protein [Terrimesophilobacter sp.]